MSREPRVLIISFQMEGSALAWPTGLSSEQVLVLPAHKGLNRLGVRT